jgi:hypothetical protein
MDRQLAKNTHPNHGGRHCPMAAMVPSPRHCHIQQLANMLRDKSMSLKLLLCSTKLCSFPIFSLD